jgi:hypothetical protein
MPHALRYVRYLPFKLVVGLGQGRNGYGRNISRLLFCIISSIILPPTVPGLIMDFIILPPTVPGLIMDFMVHNKIRIATQKIELYYIFFFFKIRVLNL